MIYLIGRLSRVIASIIPTILLDQQVYIRLVVFLLNSYQCSSQAYMPTRKQIVGGLDELCLVILRLRDLYLVIVVQPSLVVNRVVRQRDITSLMSTFSLLSYDLFDFIVLQLYLLYQLRDQYLFLVLFVIYQLYVSKLLVIYQVQIQST